ncbi:MAG: hypothetical protein GF409_05655 [Candidatus Omnitrophica bacterium]|nr:hypothetical protein [Candidatus Omnitrophota bacterium]
MKRKKVLALGADLKNRALLADGCDFYYTGDAGDLSDAANYASFRKGVLRLLKKADSLPEVIAYDLHPGFYSARFAREYIEEHPRVKECPVQHHHAHIASVMQEHGLNGPVIGVSFDGTGYGSDGASWGGEFLVVDRKSFRRAAHLEYIKMPGGDKVIAEPWRMALSITGTEAAPLLGEVPEEDIKIVLDMIERGFNTPLTSSAGRLFDAAAALTGLCQYARHPAEGPIKLEALCRRGEKGRYPYSVRGSDGLLVADTREAFRQMTSELTSGESKSACATRFHNTMIDVVASVAGKLAETIGLNEVVLSGGVFQNEYLREGAVRELSRKCFKVYTNNNMPVSDLNIALGQYYVSCNSC